MKRIGLLSDTHSLWDDRYAHHFASCDEVWHAGDIGTAELADRFVAMGKPFRAVYGNIDGGVLRQMFPRQQRFVLEGVDVLMTHIGGYPGKYDRTIAPTLFARPPRLFICGHSHILKVQYDRTLQCLHLNPGAAGTHGWHKQRTLMRFVLEAGEIKDLEIIELNENLPEHPAISPRK